MSISIREWNGVGNPHARNYTCGHPGCGQQVSSEKGWVHNNPAGNIDGFIYTCPNCKRPTFFDLADKKQFPGVALGNEVKSLPDNIGALWSEIRTCTSHGAYTAAVLAGRTLLMHIAVEQGAAAGQTFVHYVDYLVNNHYAPPNSKIWVDKIRAHGNEATHEVVLKTQSDADEIVVFLEMLLKFIYEFPSRT